MKILCSRSNLLAGALAFAGKLIFNIPAVAQDGGGRSAGVEGGSLMRGHPSVPMPRQV